MSVLSTGRGSAGAAELNRLDQISPAAITASAPAGASSAVIVAPASAASGVQGIPTR
jgi:hypothetical protein